MAARLEAPRAGVRPVTVTAPARRAGLARPRLPAAAELATTGAGYLGYALVRLAAQRRLLSAAGVSLPWRTVSGVVFASTGLARVMPAGPVARGRLAGRGVPAPRRGRRGRVVGCAGGRAHLHGRRLGAAAGRGRGSWHRLPRTTRRRGRSAGRRHGRTYRSGAPRRDAQPVAEPASSPLAHNRPAGCGCGRVVTPGRRVRLGGWGAGAHRRGPARRRGSACRLFRAGRAAGAVARAAVRLRRAAGRPARPAARRARRCGRRRARRAHAHRHPARSSRSRGHRLPSGGVLGRRCRRDRGGGHPRPPPQPRDWGRSGWAGTCSRSSPTGGARAGSSETRAASDCRRCGWPVSR